MRAIDKTNRDQAAHWGGAAGRNWAAAQAQLDQIFKPIEERIALAARRGERVLDIGCGAGATTLAIARRVGAQGRVFGLDIAPPMIAAAEARAEAEDSTALFALGDAQSYAFEPAGFDHLVSRFGVMFFVDPVAAFANLRRAAAAEARLTLAVWRAPEDNPFMTAAEQAAAPLLPAPPARVKDAPGQFGLADAGRVARILRQAGWDGVEIAAEDFDCAFPRAALEGYVTRLGPVSGLLPDLAPDRRAAVVEAMLGGFEPFIRGDEIRFTAALWMIERR